MTRPTQDADSWQWRYLVGDTWSLWEHLSSPVDVWCEAFDGQLERGTVELRPLYAHPPASSAVREALEKLTNAMRFVLAFYEPGQRHLDTNAWKNAEANARHAFAEAEQALAAEGTKESDGQATTAEEHARQPASVVNESSPSDTPRSDAPEWPIGCADPSSCASHRACMYLHCKHDDQSVIDALLTKGGTP